MELNFVKYYLNKKDGSNVSQYLGVVTACIAVFTTGFHYGWATPSLKKIMSDEYPFHISPDEGSTITVVAYVGHVAGGFGGCALADIIGRKWTILAISIPQMIAFLSIYFSYLAKELLYVARISGGIGEGSVLAIVPMYAAEISDPEIRGKLGTYSTSFIFGGALFINLLGSFVDIHTTALICMIFPVLLWLLFSNMPESPYYLLMKNKTEEARESLQVFKRKETVEKELASLSDDVKRQMSERGSFIDLFSNPVNRKALFIVASTRIFQLFTGITAYSNYYQILIQQSTNISPVLGSTLLMIIQMLMMACTTFFIDRYGRKVLLIVSSSSISVVLYILGTFLMVRDFTTVDVSPLSWFPLLMMVLFTICYCSGFAIVVTILTSEMFSNSIKAKGVAVASIVFAGSMVGTTKYYQFTADHISLGVPFLTFATCSLLATIFVYFKVIETKGKTLETIQQELRGKPRRTSHHDQS